MKKLLLAAIFVLAVFAASAREPVIRYQGDLQMGYSWGGENLSRFNLLHMVNSVRITRYFSLGVGMGVDVHTEKYRAGSYYGIPIMEKKRHFLLPLYGQLRGYVPVSKRVEFTLGADVGVMIKEFRRTTDNPMFLSPALGVRLRTGAHPRRAVTLTFSYDMIPQFSSEPAFGSFDDSLDLEGNSFTMRVGYSF